MRLFTRSAGFFLVLLLVGLGSIFPEGIDNSIYGELLREHVVDGLVDYDGFKKDEILLDRYLDILAKVDTERLAAPEAFAFYVNAYNAWTIKLILNNYPGVRSIKSIGGPFRSPWKQSIADIDGETLTLDDIEHGILRPRYNDSRVHFAVNCASIGCPPIRSEPYTGIALDTQLNDATRSFINDPGKTYIDGTTLFVSRIFKWYAEDFPEGVIEFVSRYAEGDLRQQLESKKDTLRVRYLDYDWSLNSIP